MRPEKKAMFDELRGQLDASSFVLLTNFQGLTVSQFAELRGQLREETSKMTVVRNTILERSAADLGWDDAGTLIDGPTAVITGEGEVTAVIKKVKKFIDANSKPRFTGGRLGDRTLSVDDVEVMAKIPSREVLLGQVVGTIAAPMTQLVGVFNQKISSLVYVLKAIEEKKTSGE